MADLRVLIAGGGTGGHVIPALAIARALRDQHGAEVRMVGTARGLETKLVPEAGFRLELVHVGQLKNVSLATRARTAFDLPRGILRCISLLAGVSSERRHRRGRLCLRPGDAGGLPAAHSHDGL